MPFPYARLIVGKRHVQSPDFGNTNNSDATRLDITHSDKETGFVLKYLVKHRKSGKKPGFWAHFIQSSRAADGGKSSKARSPQRSKAAILPVREPQKHSKDCSV